ncbi:MAG: hypothetical protein ACJA2E_002131 [Arenicella sp.]|jgi:hypothetical protein
MSAYVFFCLPTDWSLNRLLAIVLISSFAVLSHWGVWSNGVFSIGLNTSLTVDIFADVNTALNDRRLLNTNAWINWQRNKADEDCERPWFESNLSLELNCLATDISQLPESHWRSY